MRHLRDESVLTRHLIQSEVSSRALFCQGLDFALIFFFAFVAPDSTDDGLKDTCKEAFGVDPDRREETG